MGMGTGMGRGRTGWDRVGREIARVARPTALMPTGTVASSAQPARCKFSTPGWLIIAEATWASALVLSSSAHFPPAPRAQHARAHRSCTSAESPSAAISITMPAASAQATCWVVLVSVLGTVRSSTTRSHQPSQSLAFRSKMTRPSQPSPSPEPALARISYIDSTGSTAPHSTPSTTGLGQKLGCTRSSARSTPCSTPPEVSICVRHRLLPSEGSSNAISSCERFVPGGSWITISISDRVSRHE